MSERGHERFLETMFEIECDEREGGWGTAQGLSEKLDFTPSVVARECNKHNRWCPDQYFRRVTQSLLATARPRTLETAPTTVRD